MNRPSTSEDKLELPEFLREDRVRMMLALAARCARLNGDIEVSAEVGRAESMAITAFFLAHEHHGGIVELLQSGRLGSALAMLRPCFEAMLTGLWLLRGANEDQIALYGQGRISNRAEDMLRGLRKSASSEEDAFLQNTWRWSKTSLHQYTHCTFQLLARRSNGTLTDGEISPEEVVNAMRFATGTAMLATVELARIGVDKKLEEVSLAILGQLYPS